MAKEHPSDPRPNRYMAKCCHCGHHVAPGKGATEKIMGTTNGWRTYHVACDQQANPSAYPANS